LTKALQDNISNGKLASLDPNDVEPFLAKVFQYRMTLMNDSEVGNANVPSLKISIVNVEVQLPKATDEMPVWGEMKRHIDVNTR